ncbi:GNAT family N-acetyltransferase [Marivita sp. S6314]|uniref:GNAT family N-acetyltransferase n=1 Tax=Marivita sp. S6314 TaxID=2926406 RepID=UPI001FF42E88|nr:GNAT family N-acetyltransferase [Marivita sp. S6314]MCK0149044.1 GNAT family N-acetyltransferase [Marivita sp. S6314]
MTQKTMLRLYTPADHDWLVTLHRSHYAAAEGFDDSFGDLVDDILSQFERQHNPDCERGWVAERDGVPLGSVFCVRLDNRTAKLRLFLLAPEARGLGLGKRLLETCMNFARQSGFKQMRLWTHESHEAACALYQKYGWTCTSSEPVHSFGVDLVEQAWEVTL